MNVLRRERWNLVLCAAFIWALWPVHLYFRDQVPGSGPDGVEGDGQGGRALDSLPLLLYYEFIILSLV